jgi:hypothetical protein
MQNRRFMLPHVRRRLTVLLFSFASVLLLGACEGGNAALDLAQAGVAAGSAAAAHASDPPTDLPPCPSSRSTDACECKASAPHEECVGECDGTSCDYVCDGETSCTHTCNGASCDYWCEAGATCDFSCLGGDCTFHCAAGSTCTTDCTGGTCTDDCADGASCMFCKNGSC